MTTFENLECVAGAVPSHRVVVTISWAMLPNLREALSTLSLSSVLVSAATSWDEGRAFSYRGQRYRSDREVARVEITCAQRYVDLIANAIEGLPTKAGEQQRRDGALIVFPLTPVPAALTPSLA